MNKTFSIAPIYNLTSKFFLRFFNIISNDIELFFPMFVINYFNKEIVNNINSTILNNFVKNSVLQIATSNENCLREFINFINEKTISEINLNLGCTSKSAKSGNYGYFLMQQKCLLKACLYQMSKFNNIFSCKIRMFENCKKTIEIVKMIVDSGCKKIIIHARYCNSKSIRSNLNSPLFYEEVIKIKSKFPKINIIINGGIDSIEKIILLNKEFDGIMLGRYVYRNPFFLFQFCEKFLNKKININKTIIKYVYFFLNRISYNDFNKIIMPILLLIKKNSRENLKNMLKEFFEKKIKIESIIKYVYKEIIVRYGQIL